MRCSLIKLCTKPDGHCDEQSQRLLANLGPAGAHTQTHAL
jgi:hypothetical protein